MLCALATMAAFAAKAQSVAPASAAAGSDDAVVSLEKVVVTGSNIPTAGEATSTPVQVISFDQVANTGVANDLLDLIHKSSPQFSGNGNLGNTNANISSGSTNGASAVAMRNAATLVLVNGRRLANAPVAATGGGVFVDVNAIPIEAIERIEILKDGASAIYGSDAVSGVMNVILKSNYDGLLVGGRYARTNNEGHYSERSAYAVSGVHTDSGFKAVASFEWTKTDPLYNGQREFSRPSYGTTNFAGVVQVGSYVDGSFIGGDYYFLDPSLTAPKAGATLSAMGYTGPYTSSQILRLFDLSKYVTQRMSNQKEIGTFNFEQKIGTKLKAFGDFILSRTDTTSQLNAQPVSIKMTATNANNQLSSLGLAVSVRNRFIDHPRTYRAITQSFRGIAGLKGDLTDQWSFETAVNYNHSTQEFANGGLIRSTARAAAVSAGKLNLFSRTQDPAVISTILGEAKGSYASDLNSLDFKLVGSDLVKLPGGGLSLAVGGELRQEKLKATSDPDSQSATFAYDSGTSIDPFDQKRNISSAFAEVSVPLVGKENRLPGIYAADFTGAVRHEIYSDGQDPTVPKFALSYAPMDDSFKFRGSISRSFSAPTIYQLHSPTGIGFSNPVAEFGSNQANQMSTPVTGLSPSKSRNISFGFVWTPKSAKGFSMSLDLFDMKQSAIISNLGATGVVDQVFHDVEVKGASSPYAKMVHIGDFTGATISAPGQISQYGLDNIYFIIPAASNLGAQKMRGYDLNMAYETSNLSFGKLRFETTATYYSYFDVQVAPGADYTPTAGLVTGLVGTMARWRSYSTVTYKVQNFTAVLGHNYSPRTRDTGWTSDYSADGYNQYIASYSTFDLRLSYALKGNSFWFKGMKVSVGVDNLANRMPSKSATFDGLSNADIGEFSSVGRLLYVSAEYKF
jgi:iron complex outermembrane receptor protein